MSYAVQKKEGQELNRFYEEDKPIHDWYRFVLSFPPHLVRHYISKFNLNKQHCVLDPFCGTGTTLVECKKNGISSVGIEANPVAHLAAKTKTSWNIDCKGLVEHANLIASETEKKLKNKATRLEQLCDEKYKLLITNSISPIPLHKSICLISTLSEFHDARFANYERLALAKQLVCSFSNLHFGPEVGVSKKKKTDIDVTKLWLKQVEDMANDIRWHSKKTQPSSYVYLGDSREIGKLIEPNSIDAVITSPPYPNEKDYSRTTRLESVLLGYINTKSDLRQCKETFLRSNTRNVYKNDCDEKWIKGNKAIAELSAAIERKRIELGKTSGFEKLYHRVVLLYFGGMARHLSELKEKLRPGAKLAYVVGDQASYFRVLIRTGELLAEIGQSLGFELLDIDLHRTRLSTATGEQLREEVVLFQWNG